MKNNNKICLIFFLCIAAFGCQNNKSKEAVATDSTLFKDTTPAPEKDPRPTAEVAFLNRIKAESDYQGTSDAIKKDTHIAAFNKYASDSLKNISGWEMIVVDINDNDLSMNSFASVLGLSGPVYNLVLTAPVKIDTSVDTLSIGNRVDFTYTLPKSPKGEVLRKQLETIKTLNKGDVVIISGSLTHVNEKGKIDFSSFYDLYGPWNVDLLLNDVSKSKTNNYQYLKKINY